MNLPNEILNKIFSYIESPTASLIKVAHNEYLSSYDEEYQEFYFSFQDQYFQTKHIESGLPKFCRCHMINNEFTNNTICIFCCLC
jgi:hypothetical protein